MAEAAVAMAAAMVSRLRSTDLQCILQNYMPAVARPRIGIATALGDACAHNVLLHCYCMKPHATASANRLTLRAASGPSTSNSDNSGNGAHLS